MAVVRLDRHVVVRAGIALVAIAVLGVSVAAVAVTQSLKLGRAPIAPTEDFTRLFAPGCDCPTAEAQLAFLVRKRDRVSVWVVDRDRRVVRTLEQGRDVRRGRHTFTWDGRDDAGAIVPDGAYRVQLELEAADRRILVPTTIRTDTVAPEVELLRAGPRTISPNGDGRNERVRVRYRSTERGQAVLTVHGRTVVVGLRRARGVAGVNWNGRFGGRAAPQGTFPLSLEVRDRAGNVSEPVDLGEVTVRYLRLLERDLRVRPRQPLVFSVDTDAEQFTWQLVRQARSERPERVAVVRVVRTAGPGPQKVTFELPTDGGVPPGRYLLRVAPAGLAPEATYEDETVVVFQRARRR